MPVLNQYQARRRSSMFFLSVSTLIHLALLIGVSLLLFPDFVKQTILPTMEVTLQDNSMIPKQTTLESSDLATVKRDSTARVETVEPENLAINDSERAKTQILGSRHENASRYETTLQLNAELIQQITADLFAQADKNSVSFAALNLPGVARINSYVSSDFADRWVNTVAFYFPSGSHFCAQYSEPNPLDSFDPGYWWLIPATTCELNADQDTTL